MKFRSLLDLIIRPIPAAETPDAVRARRTGDYVVAAILGLFVLAGLYWGLHRQITQAPGDFSDRDPKKVDEPEKPRDAVEVQLTLTPGEDEGPAQPVATPADEVGTGLAPAVASFPFTACRTLFNLYAPRRCHDGELHRSHRFVEPSKDALSRGSAVPEL